MFSLTWAPSVMFLSLMYSSAGNGFCHVCVWEAQVHYRTQQNNTIRPFLQHHETNPPPRWWRSVCMAYETSASLCACPPFSSSNHRDSTISKCGAATLIIPMQRHFTQSCRQARVLHQSLYLHPTIIMATEKIFSPSVVGAMLPNPMVVRLVMVKYKEVM